MREDLTNGVDGDEPEIDSDLIGVAHGRVRGVLTGQRGVGAIDDGRPRGAAGARRGHVVLNRPEAGSVTAARLGRGRRGWARPPRYGPGGHQPPGPPGSWSLRRSFERTGASAAGGPVSWAGGPDALRGCCPAGRLAGSSAGRVCATTGLRPGFGSRRFRRVGAGGVYRCRRCWARLLDSRMEVRMPMLQKVTGSLRISRCAARIPGRAGIVGYHSAPLVSQRRKSRARQEETGE